MSGIYRTKQLGGLAGKLEMLRDLEMISKTISRKARKKDMTISGKSWSPGV
jgi:hypothetical protein